MTTPQPQHAIDAAKEIAIIAGSLRLAFEQDAAAIIASHPDPELARLEHENSALITQADRLRARVAELEARILSDNKAYGCELRDPNGTIWEYAETLKKRVAELELQTFDIKKLEADKARLDWLETGQHETVFLSRYDGGTEFWIKGYLHLGVFLTLRAAIDAARNAKPAVNTGDKRRTGG